MEAAGDWSAHSLLFDKGGMVIYFKRPHDDDGREGFTVDQMGLYMS